MQSSKPLAGGLGESRRETRTCDIHGEYSSLLIASFTITPPPPYAWSPCPKCNELQIDEIRRQESRNLRARLRQSAPEILLARSAIPQRFQTRSFANFVTKTEPQRVALDKAQRYAKAFDRHLVEGNSLTFLGRPGTGKTHLAAGIAREICMQGHSALYITVLDYIRAIRECWNSTPRRSELETLRQFMKPELLILDDAGVQYDSDAERVLLSDLMDHRSAECRPVLMLSNLDRQELKACIGERAYDRLRDGDVVFFEWDSWRGNDRKFASAGTDK